MEMAKGAGWEMEGLGGDSLMGSSMRKMILGLIVFVRGLLRKYFYLSGSFTLLFTY
jgi:hypothetical protein